MEDHPDFLAVVMSDGYAPVQVFIVDPRKKGHRVHKVLIKMAFVGDHIRRQRGIALDNLRSLQMLATASSRASGHHGMLCKYCLC